MIFDNWHDPIQLSDGAAAQCAATRLIVEFSLPVWVGNAVGTVLVVDTLFRLGMGLDFQIDLPVDHDGYFSEKGEAVLQVVSTAVLFTNLVSYLLYATMILIDVNN